MNLWNKIAPSMDLEIIENISKINENLHKFPDMILFLMNYFIVSCIYLKQYRKVVENVSKRQRMFEKYFAQSRQVFQNLF